MNNTNVFLLTSIKCIILSKNNAELQVLKLVELWKKITTKYILKGTKVAKFHQHRNGSVNKSGFHNLHPQCSIMYKGIEKY
jgi:hypothetical protein